MTLSKYIEKKYEQEFGEPWSALEERVRKRNKDFFTFYDNYPRGDENPEVKKWWQFWK